ncbi:MAG: hypothetical protein WDN45_04390 [Caulobacteraceae bacterium]
MRAAADAGPARAISGDDLGCNDCHTPGGFSPHPDAKRLLAGSTPSSRSRAWACSFHPT